jgi:uncharacterized membrane protein YfcA
MFFIIVLVSFFASILKLFSGFGLATLLMPVVAIFFPVAIAVALTAFVHLLNNLFKLAVLWRYVNWQISFTFGIPALLSTIPGALLLTKLQLLSPITEFQFFGINAAITPVKLAVGVLLIIFATVEGFSLSNKTNISTRYLPAGGILSGFFGGLSGHQGAFRSTFLLHAEMDKNQFVATNAVIASLVDITRLVVYGVNIKLLMQNVDYSLIIAATIASFAGVLVGKAGLEKINIGFIQKLVTVMLYILGVSLLIGII